LPTVPSSHKRADRASSWQGKEIAMKLFLMSTGIVLGFLTVADFATSSANDARTHARWAAEARCLDTNTAALPEVQRMCAVKALKEFPER
jgi:hypothetical protein